jgi:hypothetical protein
VDSIREYLSEYPLKKCSALLYSSQTLNCTIYSLSNDYNLSEIANNLFSAMRIADGDDSQCILVERIKEEGIGRAIADRLKRASTSLSQED